MHSFMIYHIKNKSNLGENNESTLIFINLDF